MKILVIGDIFGKMGRKIIKENLPLLKKNHQIDLVIANVENVTHGKGLSLKHYEELKTYGINIMTSGNHIFHLKETLDYIKKTDDLLRPLNSNPYHPGKGSILLTLKNKKIRITNLLGNIFMPFSSENPFFSLEKIIKKKDCDIHLVDFHAETTAEKIAFALYYDGKISALWGTHTHVQTSDERILPKGTAFITDLGMTGSLDGIIGCDSEAIFEKNKYYFSKKFFPKSEGNGQLNGLIINFLDNNNQITYLKRIKLLYKL